MHVPGSPVVRDPHQTTTRGAIAAPRQRAERSRCKEISPLFTHPRRYRWPWPWPWPWARWARAQYRHRWARAQACQWRWQGKPYGRGRGYLGSAGYVQAHSVRQQRSFVASFYDKVARARAYTIHTHTHTDTHTHTTTFSDSGRPELQMNMAMLISAQKAQMELMHAQLQVTYSHLA